MDTNSSNNNSQRQVILEGGLPWGFRIQGGSDSGVQLRIARVSRIIPTRVSVGLLNLFEFEWQLLHNRNWFLSSAQYFGQLFFNF